MNFTWDGKNVVTFGDIMNAVSKIKDRAIAKEFMKVYAESIDGKSFDEAMRIVKQNIGYMSGYCGNDEMKEIQDIFETAHPIFGRSVPTPKEALEAGMKSGGTI